MNVLITGSNGFIARNLIIQIKNLNFNVIKFDKKNSLNQLKSKIIKSDIIFHLAGENRSKRNKDFYKNNCNLTKKITDIIISNNLKKKIIFSSSSQVLKDKNNVYSKTKLLSENEIKKCNKKTKSIVSIYRIPNVYGKWSRENYNSVFATFAYNISRSKKVKIFDENKKIELIYIDDLVNILLKECKITNKSKIINLKSSVCITPKKLKEILDFFKKNRSWFGIKGINPVILKNMYSSFLTYAPPNQYIYNLEKKEDHRGCFVEFLKMGNSGQISYFTIKKGKSRGMHFHNTKIEKFIILKGKVKFEFKNLISNKTKSYYLNENQHKVIETVPGWLHTVKNIGIDTVLGVIWANEEFKIDKSDTYNLNE